MNITGHGQYSKQTAGIKDLKKIMDQQQKLIFIYPMLFADKIKISDMQSFTLLIRDFISVTFLSDLFIQNSFNVIGIANQIRPLWDERHQEVDPSSAILRLVGAQQGVYQTGPVMPNYPVGPEHTDRLQQKITQKTTVIQQLIKSDPKLAKTRPFIEIITLGNMIDVPVIVGTAQYPVDTLTLMYTLIAAIGLNKKLNNEADLEIIFKELETLDEKKYWSLLNNLTKSPTETIDLSDWFRGKMLSGLRNISGWGHRTPVIARTAGNLASRLQKRINNPPELEQQHQMLAPLLLNKTDLDQTKLYFKFILNPGFAKKQFGIDASNESSSLSGISQAKLQGELKKIQSITMANFAELVGTLGTSLLLSIVNLISIDIPNVNVMLEKSQNIDIMMGEVDKQLNEILVGIDNGMKGSSVEESRNNIKTLKELCKIDSSESLIEFMNRAESASISSNDFGMINFREFITYINEFAHTSNSLSEKIKNQILYMTNEQERSSMKIRFDNLQKAISRSLAEFFKPFKTDLDNAPPSQLARVNGLLDNSQIIAKTIPKFESELSEVFNFMLLSYLQASLCKFILVADVDLETVSNEVTSWPNYTLVLPVEIIMALHAATMGTSWKHMLSGGRIGTNLIDKTTNIKDPISGTSITTERNKPMTKDQVGRSKMFNLNDSYVKGVIKFISQRLDVPNLIVVDSKKGDIYYKLMNQSDINKTKISTIETFIQSKLNRQMVS